MHPAIKSLALGFLSLGVTGVAVGCAHTADTTPVVPSSALQMSSGDKAVAFAGPHDGVV